MNSPSSFFLYTVYSSKGVIIVGDREGHYLFLLCYAIPRAAVFDCCGTYWGKASSCIYYVEGFFFFFFAPLARSADISQEYSIFFFFFFTSRGAIVRFGLYIYIYIYDVILFFSFQRIHHGDINKAQRHDRYRYSNFPPPKYHILVCSLFQ